MGAGFGPGSVLIFGRAERLGVTHWSNRLLAAELGVSNLKEKATHDYVRHGTITFFPALG